MRPSSYIEIDVRALRRLYVEEHLPMTAVAKRLGCSSITVARRLRLYRDRGAAARPDSNKSNDIGAAGRLVAEPGVGDRRDRDGRQSLARRSPSRRAIQGSRHAGDPSSLPRTNESDRAHIERSRRPNPYASVERSCILSLAARYRPDAREEPDPATTRDSRRILSRFFSRMHRW